MQRIGYSDCMSQRTLTLPETEIEPRPEKLVLYHTKEEKTHLWQLAASRGEKAAKTAWLLFRQALEANTGKDGRKHVVVSFSPAEYSRMETLRELSGDRDVATIVWRLVTADIPPDLEEER